MIYLLWIIWVIVTYVNLTFWQCFCLCFVFENVYKWKLHNVNQLTNIFLQYENIEFCSFSISFENSNNDNGSEFYAADASGFFFGHEGCQRSQPGPCAKSFVQNWLSASTRIKCFQSCDTKRKWWVLISNFHNNGIFQSCCQNIEYSILGNLKLPC